ncbi:MAG: shikimate kinase [Pirellulaceae bacterium]
MSTRIFLTGVSCVGKTTIGPELAAILGVAFVDLDEEIERFFKKPIARLQAETLTMASYRAKACQALRHVLARDHGHDCVLALPPSGLMDRYWSVVKKASATTVWLRDTPERILERLTFYDEQSRPIEKTLNEQERPLYLKEIKKDISYFRRSHQRAHVAVDIAGLGPRESAIKVKEAVESFLRSQRPP